jgi:hypothetical protein
LCDALKISYFWASQKTFISMALLKMMTTINPATGTSVVGGSAYYIYNTDQINWQTLASKTGTTASSVFDYQLNGGGIGKAAVKGTVTQIQATASPATIVA